MNREIFLLRDEGTLVELREEPYASEDLLQKLLEKYPGLLSGPQIDPDEPRRWLMVRRELRLPSDEGGGGRLFLDHLLLDQDAIPTLVEVKRCSDPRIRREVAGQMLDYAANAVRYLPLKGLIAQFEEQCRIRDTSPDNELAAFLGPDASLEEFWQKVKTNLQAGRIRLLFVADVIPAELRTIVEFLNEQMDPAEVLAIEIRQFVGEGLRTLVPTVIGQTSEAQQRKGVVSGVSRQWDETSFFTELATRVTPAEVDIAKQLLQWAQRKVTRVWWGQGRSTGSFVPVLDLNNTAYSLFACYTYGAVEIYFQWFKSRTPFDEETKRLALLEKFNSAPGINLSADSITRRPGVRLSALTDPKTFSVFISAFEWFLAEVQAVAIQQSEGSR